MGGLDPPSLLTRVQAVPRVGPWTAGASVADLTNDYAWYPFGDLAVRAWATAGTWANLARFRSGLRRNVGTRCR
ncbi:MAG: hypothetical protein ACR2G2_20030 [Pseudonocardia sp.]